jgi:transposase-like protein
MLGRYYVNVCIPRIDIVFDGHVEIDESLFGRKAKYNRGNPTGTRIWIFGMVQRSSNKIIMYPVDKRDAQTLIPLIKKHVSPGSRIFLDSWAAYIHLNQLGYGHFFH